MIKIIRHSLILTFFTVAIHGYSYPEEGRDTIFQTSIITALLEGIYDGDVTYRDLRKHGDFGLGTFNGLDGEMIEMEGKFYQIKADGVAYPVDDSMKTPFAVVTFFEPDKDVLLDKAMDCKQLEQYIGNLLPTKNIFYAIKIEGLFKYIKARSVPKQNKPYPRLIEVVKNQPTFEFHDVKGTMAGFWFPDYMKEINVSSYHFHFITDDKKAGGHLLECQLQNVRIEIDYTSELHISLPERSDFYKTKLEKEKETKK